MKEQKELKKCKEQCAFFNVCNNPHLRGCEDFMSHKENAEHEDFLSEMSYIGQYIT